MSFSVWGDENGTGDISTSWLHQWAQKQEVVNAGVSKSPCGVDEDCGALFTSNVVNPMGDSLLGLPWFTMVYHIRSNGVIFGCKHPSSGDHEEIRCQHGCKITKN